MGLLFRLDARSRWAVEKGGATLVGTGTTFGQNGVTFDGNGNLRYRINGLPERITIVIEFYPAFAADDGVTHYFCDSDDGALNNRTLVYKTNANRLVVTAGATTTIFNVATAGFINYWVVGQKNVLTISMVSGAELLWLNGYLIATAAVAFSQKPNVTQLCISGNTVGGAGTRFVGTISRFEIYGNVATAVDEPYLRAGTLISKLDDFLVAIPGTSYYKRASDGLFVTDVLGSANIGQALMGSDGSTVGQFPTVAKQAGLVRGFGFTGAQQLNLGAPAALSFTNGVNDLSFSLVCVASQTTASSQAAMAKSAGVTAGEYLFEINVNAGIVELLFLLIDETAGAYIGRYGTLNVKLIPGLIPIAVTYSGGGIGGIRLYANSVRVDTTNATFGAYVRMRNTAKTFRVGNDESGLLPMRGSLVLPSAFDFELSPLQAKALTARLQRTARVA